MSTPDLMAALRPGDPVVVACWEGRRVPHAEGRAVLLGWQRGRVFARVGVGGVEFPWVHRDLLRPVTAHV